MSTQNWNGGDRLTISKGNPLQCTNQIINPINVAFLYNSTQAAQRVPIDFVGANAYYEQVSIPETTGNAGSAAMLTFSGPNEGGSASLTATLDSLAGKGATAQAWLGGQQMPTNDTGLDNRELPADGGSHSFNKYARYYFVPSAQRYVLTVRTGITAFYFAMFNPAGQVFVHVLNAPDASYKPMVKHFPGDTYAINNTTVKAHTSNSIQVPLFGNNQQWVVMNADSVADSEGASIMLQKLG